MHTLTHAEVSELARLRTKSRERRGQGRFFLEGEKVISDALAAGWELEYLVVTPASAARYAALLAANPSLPVRQTDGDGMARLSGVQTAPGLVGIARMPTVSFDQVAGLSLIACLDGVADPGNLGTMIRTADWFGVEGLILDADGVDPYNDKVVRSSMGSLFHVRIWESANLAEDLAELKRRGTKLLVTDVRGSSDAIPDGNLCLVMGSESHGVRPEVLALADQTYTIPGSGQAESLNVAVSFGIALHHITSSR